jgi:DNA (cytosine-5)-methyltransferase 1
MPRLFMKPSITFGSVCSGIEAASVAWHPLGWRAAWLSEIEPFPSAVLAHHYPDVPNLGDMTLLPARIRDGEVVAPDVFCGGTPCQAFSVAGLRKSLDDARGNLSLTFCEIANEIDSARSVLGLPPAVIFWENVPGVLSTSDNAFGCFLGALAGESSELQPAGGKWTNAGCVFGPARTVAWRVLDAQYFGVAQRRRRVFVVASARTGFDPVKVLFELDGVRRDTAPSRETGQVAPTIPARSLGGGGLGTDFDCDGGIVRVCPTLRAGGNRTGGDRPPGTDVDTADSLIPVSFAIQAGALRTNPASGPDGVGVQADHAYTLEARAEVRAVASVAVRAEYYSHDYCHDRIYSADGLSPALNCSQEHAIRSAMQVRRLTPEECEALQGFPRGYTMIPWRKRPADQCPDGPRYKALGNSWAVPNVRWIGQRIAEALL